MWNDILFRVGLFVLEKIMLSQYQKIIVLAADYRYAEHVITTIKSVCYHNNNILFYLFNRDFPKEWFDILNQQMTVLNCKICDIKICHDMLKNYPTFAHINSEATFYRYFISTFVPHDKVLYLDCDLVVNTCLDDLFDMDLQDYFVAVVKDPIAEHFHQLDEFNAGVMLINNKLWKQHHITEQCLNLTQQRADTLKNGDQEILNIVLKDKYLQLNRGYNYQVGLDYMLYVSNQTHLIEDLGDIIPCIVHYSTFAKPWQSDYLTRFRHLYWFYYQLNWQDIYSHN